MRNHYPPMALVLISLMLSCNTKVVNAFQLGDSQDAQKDITFEIKPDSLIDDEIIAAFDTTVINKYHKKYTREELNTASKEHYVSEREQEMIIEINSVRSNPDGYIKYIEHYIKKKEKAISKGYAGQEAYIALNAARELVRELEVVEPSRMLKPSEGIYKAAVVHGNEAKKRGVLRHQGLDGSMPNDRILKFDSDSCEMGNQNYVNGPKDVRDAVIVLLVDAIDKDRRNRRVLLDTTWYYVACHEVGQVGTTPNNWLQIFGQKKIKKKPEKDSTLLASNGTGGQSGIMSAPNQFNNTTTTNYNNTTTSSNYNSSNQVGKRYSDDPRYRAATNHNTTTQTTHNQSYTENQPTSTYVPHKPKTNYIVNASPKSRPYQYNADAFTVFGGDKQYSDNLNTAATIRYMTPREREMVAEINLLRSNPKAYAKHIEDYIQLVQSEIVAGKAWVGAQDEIQVCQELKQVLSTTASLSILNPHEGVYKSALTHGQMGKKNGYIDYIEVDGSTPESRIQKYAPTCANGGENLIGGSDIVRLTMIRLLIDQGDSSRTQRKNLLNPNWRYIGCYEVGKLGDMPFYWVQNFGM